jgi:hypothetical protein
MNFKSLKLMSKKCMVYGLSYIEDKKDICEGCTRGKIHRKSFSKEKA